MHFPATIAQLSGQEDNLGQDQLGDGSRVGEGRVEDGDALLGRDLQIDLVGSDAETTNDAQFLGGVQDFFGELGL